MYRHFKYDIDRPNCLQSFNILLLSFLTNNLLIVWDLLLDLDEKIFLFFIKCAFELNLIIKIILYFKEKISYIHTIAFKNSFLKNLNNLKCFLKKSSNLKIKHYTRVAKNNRQASQNETLQKEVPQNENIESAIPLNNLNFDNNPIEIVDNYTLFKNIFIFIKFFNLNIINPSVFTKETEKMKGKKCLLFNIFLLLIVCIFNLIIMIIKLMVLNISFFIIIILTVYFPIAFINLGIFLLFIGICIVYYCITPLSFFIIIFFSTLFILIDIIFFHTINMFLIIFFCLTYPIRLFMFYIINITQKLNNLSGCYF